MRGDVHRVERNAIALLCAAWARRRGRIPFKAYPRSHRGQGAAVVSGEALTHPAPPTHCPPPELTSAHKQVTQPDLCLRWAPPHSEGGGGGGGGLRLVGGWVRGQKKVCVPKIDAQFRAPLLNYCY